MLDIKLIRKETAAVKKKLQKRKVKAHVIDEIIALDEQYRNNIQAQEEIKEEKNNFNKSINKLSNDEKTEKIQAMSNLAKKEDELSEEKSTIYETLNKLLMELPNIPDDDVITGQDENDNKVIKSIGEKTKFNFKNKNYLDLSIQHDIIDIERAAKISGSRFSFLKKQGALLWSALVQYTQNIILKEKFVPFYSPSLVRKKVMENSGYDSYIDGQEAYFIEKDKLYLIGTGEHALLPYHSDEILKHDDLPLCYTTYSSCYRREAGSYGKDTKGILRVHQFEKQEMLILTDPEQSGQNFEKLISIQEKIVQGLELPYQLLQVCTGDLPKPSAKVIDLECWIPSENKYRETHSASNCTDYQARRNNIRFKDKSGSNQYVHILNATGITPRILIAIIENYQQADGSIKIPKILDKYCSFKEIKK
ncbi:serine--tRNA ligase [Patescibacteria group bacterium]|nr:serine--tRNA ligase [Patescibacteria group bacterium]